MRLTTAQSVDAQSKIGAVILAAGASARMGRPKQLLLYRGQTLIQWAVESALDSVCCPTVVVIGAHAELLKKELEHLPDARNNVA